MDSPQIIPPSTPINNIDINQYNSIFSELSSDNNNNNNNNNNNKNDIIQSPTTHFAIGESASSPSIITNPLSEPIESFTKLLESEPSGSSPITTTTTTNNIELPSTTETTTINGEEGVININRIINSSLSPLVGETNSPQSNSPSSSPPASPPMSPIYKAPDGSSLFSSYTPSETLKNSNFVFLCTPTYYAAKKNQKIGIFLYHRDNYNHVFTSHPQLKVSIRPTSPYWIPSSFTRKINKEKIDELSPTQFPTLTSDLTRGEAIFGPVRIKKTGVYYLKCTIELPPIPSEEHQVFTDFSFTFKLNFYGCPSKIKKVGDQDADTSKPTSISEIHFRPRENLFNHISTLQETGARWSDLEKILDYYTTKFSKNPDILSELLIEQSIGATYTGNFLEAHSLLDRALELTSSPENLFKVGYLKSAIFRIQKNYNASKLNLDICDYLFNKINLSSLHTGQYYFNKAAHEYDCLLNQKNRTNNYNQVRDQIVEKLQQASNHYSIDYKNSSLSSPSPRSINGAYRSNIRITQTILGSQNLSMKDILAAEEYLLKIPNIQIYSFTQRTQTHLNFTWFDLFFAKSTILFGNNNQLSFHFLTQGLSHINKALGFATQLGFANEIKYCQDRLSKFRDLAPKQFLNILSGSTTFFSQNHYLSNELINSKFFNNINININSNNNINNNNNNNNNNNSNILSILSRMNTLPFNNNNFIGNTTQTFFNLNTTPTNPISQNIINTSTVTNTGNPVLLDPSNITTTTTDINTVYFVNNNTNTNNNLIFNNDNNNNNNTIPDINNFQFQTQTQFSEFLSNANLNNNNNNNNNNNSCQQENQFFNFNTNSFEPQYPQQYQ
eukprot:gene698-861_t